MNEPTIIYEDADIVVLDKPSGLLVHSDGKSTDPTLVDWILKKYPEVKDVGETEVVNGVEIMRPGIVHRLDKETSGAMVVAKTVAAFNRLKKAFKRHEARKEYKAIVYGRVGKDRGYIDAPIGKDLRGGKFSAELETRGERREAQTSFRVLARGKDATALAVYPETGRTHQIRVHLRSIGHPIVCDPLYARGRECILGLSRLALHAERLILPLGDGEKEFVAPLPPEFEGAIAKLGGA